MAYSTTREFNAISFTKEAKAEALFLKDDDKLDLKKGNCIRVENHANYHQQMLWSHEKIDAELLEGLRKALTIYQYSYDTFPIKINKLLIAETSGSNARMTGHRTIQCLLSDGNGNTQEMEDRWNSLMNVRSGWWQRWQEAKDKQRQEASLDYQISKLLNVQYNEH